MSSFLAGASTDGSAGRGSRRVTRRGEVPAEKERAATASRRSAGVEEPVVRRASRHALSSAAVTRGECLLILMDACFDLGATRTGNNKGEGVRRGESLELQYPEKNRVFFKKKGFAYLGMYVLCEIC